MAGPLIPGMEGASPYLMQMGLGLLKGSNWQQGLAGGVEGSMNEMQRQKQRQALMVLLGGGEQQAQAAPRPSPTPTQPPQLTMPPEGAQMSAQPGMPPQAAPTAAQGAYGDYQFPQGLLANAGAQQPGAGLMAPVGINPNAPSPGQRGGNFTQGGRGGLAGLLNPQQRAMMMHMVSSGLLDAPTAGQLLVQQAFKGGKERRIVKDINGRSYYEDTKEPVFPNVKKTDENGFGSGMVGQALGVYNRLGPLVENGSATDEQRRLYQTAVGVLSNPRSVMTAEGLVTYPPLINNLPQFGGSRPAQSGGRSAPTAPPANDPSAPIDLGGGATLTPRPGPMKLTEGEAKARSLIPVAQDAENAVNGILETFRPGMWESAVGATAGERSWLGRQMLGPQAEAYIQARDQWIGALNRLESGANISPTEQEDAKSIYFPAPGDDEATVKRKAAARKSKMKALSEAYERVGVPGMDGGGSGDGPTTDPAKLREKYGLTPAPSAPNAQSQYAPGYQPDFSQVSLQDVMSLASNATDPLIREAAQAELVRRRGGR